MEASGTGNMKFALNGAITIGTLDGANVEMREHVGAENMVIFGLTAEEVAKRRADHADPRQVIDASPELGQALSAIASGVFSPDDRDRYKGLIDNIHQHDWFMVAADFDAYSEAQRLTDEIWNDQARWNRMAILNTARMGWFSSDRTIRQYAEEVWKLPA
jgi:starch phosphorylase